MTQWVDTYMLPPHPGGTLAWDEVMAWLNARVDKSVHVAVLLKRGDSELMVVNGEGVLQHWRSGTTGRELGAESPRDDLDGWYFAGETRFDLSELEGADSWYGMFDDTIIVRLSRDVLVEIVQQDGSP